MTSINPHYTFSYSQPEDYRFSHDSVFMARRVYEDLIAQNSQPKTALDLCAGCGIIGLDLLFHLKTDAKKIESFDFMEAQNEYESFFQNNCQALKNEIPELKTQLNFLNFNYELALKEVRFKESYDLIVCNPPYFLPTQGKLSDNQFKNRCRFFIDSNLKSLVQFIEYSLAPKASAYLIFHDLKDHKINLLQEIQSFINPNIQIDILPKIRKSEFLRLTKTRRTNWSGDTE